MKLRRTLWIRLLVYGLAIISIGGWLRLTTALRLTPWLQQFQSTPGVPYLVISGAVVCLLACVTAVAAWRCERWAQRIVRIFAVIYVAWYWINRLVFNQSPITQTNWLFALGMTILGLVYVFSVSHSFRMAWSLAKVDTYKSK